MAQPHVIANIRVAAARRGAKQADLAAPLGVSRQAISQRMLGYVDFRIDELQKLADYFDIPLAQLLADDEKASA